MTQDRDAARAAFTEAGLTYDVLSYGHLNRLREFIDEEMVSSGFMRGTYRVDGPVTLKQYRGSVYADIKCRSHYFRKREAVTFNDNGFIGFAGWADAENITPITTAFVRWVSSFAGKRVA